MDAKDSLYHQFVESYAGGGEASIPLDWPPELKKRCRFFLKMLESDLPGPSPSVVAALESSGVRASLSLEAPALLVAGAPAGPAPAGGEPGDLPGGAASPERPRDRYVIEKDLARGGMGRILLAYDRDFRRRVAIKMLPEAPASGWRVARFLEEAQATAQLEHPNIGPIYDLGMDAGGRPFFTMKWIRGRNFQEILRSGRGEVTLIRLVQMLQQVAMAIDFAHSRGVIHRDLKPQNIMAGDFGEVLVVDWGLAKVTGRSEETAVATDRRDSGAFTLAGSLQGSVPYMAPEQARGETASIDARTDVYGLGAILYEILAGEPPHGTGNFEAVLGRARNGEVAPPSKLAPGRNIPAELEAICMKALAARREERFEGARSFQDSLQRYIEGLHDAERRAAEAARLLERAREHMEKLSAAESREREAAAAEQGLRRSIRDHDGEAVKRPLWAAIEELPRIREARDRHFSQATAAYHAVLSIDPRNRDARAALAELFHGRLLAAEERKDVEAARLYEGLLRQYQDGRYEEFLFGEAAVRLETDPPGAEALLSRYDERGLLLVETPCGSLGKTPIDRRLPRGSYRVRFRLAGHGEARLPIHLDRRPERRFIVKLHPEASLVAGFIQVPGGETAVGGSPQLLSTLPAARVDVEEFFIAELPVTLEEYCAFLNDAAGGPRDHLAPAFGKESYVERGAGGRYAPITRLHPRMPVFAIPQAAMAAYCAWLGAKLGRPVRLPAEVEWERCARGADGRIYPWGNGFDWAFCKGARSRPGEPYPEPSGAYTRDISPFGVRDLAGSIRELCDGWYEEGFRPCRGGSWWNPHVPVFRADARTFIQDQVKGTDIGFRVCFSLCPPGSSAPR